jgi:thiamine-phosphate diphosphorylase
VTRQLPRLHAVTNDEVIALPDFHQRTLTLASTPNAAVHIRSGTLTGRQLTELAENFMRSSKSCQVFVNDRADVARIVDAGGVHLPTKGLSVQAARSIVSPECWIGRSTHSREEAENAAGEGADYVFLGPIWPTRSHPDREPLGPQVLSIAYDIPVIAIGGVTPERAPECLASGAYGVAMISALWYVKDTASAVRDLSLSFPP